MSLILHHLSLLFSNAEKYYLSHLYPTKPFISLHLTHTLNMTQLQFLSIEIKTLANPDVNPETLPTITIYQDPQDHYFLAMEIDTIKNAVLGMVPHLGTNCRYPLLFSVRLLPGTETDAVVASKTSSKRRRRRSRFNTQP